MFSNHMKIELICNQFDSGQHSPAATFVLNAGSVTYLRD